ncbi:hypothetical protein POVWA2_048520 [Plasmodium ovale wallikeri]|uniref:Uncharacterized protein n=1 Tax=Plasmodium ovale wallikeri TaxID=864142 RepID=A0A1A8ZK64_PLAOA|nr:hypothetical protein POVWA1_049480 [Plasmodium ovale wallikeri]SBT44752.1 hypothetical protein POVWA2_048520 [Plasmodium ovale wallikeri]
MFTCRPLSVCVHEGIYSNDALMWKYNIPCGFCSVHQKKGDNTCSFKSHTTSHRHAQGVCTDMSCKKG